MRKDTAMKFDAEHDIVSYSPIAQSPVNGLKIVFL
jgi:hypothetical protein